MIQQFRPMDLGNIIDTAWKIYKERFFTLVGIMAVANLPLAILSFLTNYNMKGNNFEDPGSLVVFGIILLAMIILSFILYPLSVGAEVKAAAEGFLGNKIGLSEAYGIGFKKYFPLLVPLFFSYINIAAGTLIGLLFFIIGSPIAYIFLMTIFIFIPQAVMIDNQGYFDAMGRSSKLVMKDFWRVLGISIVIFLIIMVIAIIINIPEFLPLIILGEKSIIGMLFYNIFSFLSGILLTPYALTAVTVLYFDLKIRNEDFGKLIELEADEEKSQVLNV